jgi:hypothetical protein
MVGFAEIEALPESEDERVVSWRVDCLLRAGCDLDLAASLAFAPHIDLHRALGLLEAGCPPETAERILL